MQFTKAILCSISIALVFTMFGCIPYGDCHQDFIYSGKIDLGENVCKGKLTIKLDELDHIIFHVEDTHLETEATINEDGTFVAKGSFLAMCISCENEFQSKDSIPYAIACNGSVIGDGKISISHTKCKFSKSDSSFVTEILFPDILVIKNN